VAVLVASLHVGGGGGTVLVVVVCDLSSPFLCSASDLSIFLSINASAAVAAAACIK
jgi:hypothetical protein